MSSSWNEIDDALLRMRRLWAPHTSGRPAAGQREDADLSSVLVVHTVGSLEGPVGVNEIAASLGVAAATASRLCDRAAEAGFIRKSISTVDARRVDVVLTSAGGELNERASAFRLDYLRQLLHDWDEDEIAAFSRMLARFATSVQDSPPRASSRSTQTRHSKASDR